MSMEARIRDFDWASTTLGPREGWAPGLRTAVAIVLGARAPLAVFWGPGLVLLYNDAWGALIGARHPGVLGRGVEEAFPEAWAAMGPGLAALLQGGEPFEARDWHLPVGQHGRTEDAWVRIGFSPIPDEDGGVAGVFNLVAETTQERQAAGALQASEERLRLALEVGRLATWDWDWDWDLTTGEVAWSDEHYRILGYAVGGVRPSHEAWAARLHPEDLAGAEAEIRAARDEARTYEHEFRAVHPDGSVRWCAARARFSYRGDGQAVRMIGVMRDVTERRRLMERQSVLIMELQHRTRNLLGVVRSMVDRTLGTSGTLEDFRLRFGARLEALARVNGLLSRLEDGDRITFDALLRAELSAHGAAAGRGARVRLEGPEGVRLRSSSVQTFALALHELATNAVKYGALSQPEGRLAVRWRVVPAAGGAGAEVAGEAGGRTREQGDGPGAARAAAAPDRGGEPWLVVDWRESGVRMPAPGEASRRGFGRELIERALPYQLGALTDYAPGPDGVRCSIRMPLLGRPRGPAGAAAPEPVALVPDRQRH